METKRSGGKIAWGCLLAVAVSLLSSGCSLSSYRHREFPGELGYSSWRRNFGMWTVSYIGRERWDLARTGDYALLRCAELAAKSGHRYFVVRDRNERVQDYHRYGRSVGGSPRALGEFHLYSVAPTWLDASTRGRPVQWASPTVELLVDFTDTKPSVLMKGDEVYEAGPLIDSLRAKYELPVQKIEGERSGELQLYRDEQAS